MNPVSHPLRGHTLVPLMVVCLAVTTSASRAQAPAGYVPPVWLAVCAPGLDAPLAPLKKWRSRRFDPRVVVSPDVAAAVKEHRPQYLLLVGDDVDGVTDAPWRIPSNTRQLYRWRNVQPKTFPSDSAYGDLDGDLLPDIPVGRIPARTPEQVAAVVKKIIAFEKRPLTPDDLRIVAWGGAPGYGPALDQQATRMLEDTVRKNAPAWLDTWMISAAEGESLCGWPPDQPAMFEQAVKRGAILSAFVAHASSQYVLSMRHAGKRIVYTRQRAEAAFASGPPLAPMVFLTCDSGRFQDVRPCIAEALLFAPGGPVATIAATTESHPLTNYYTGKSMLNALDAADSKATLGDVWVDTQKRGIKARSFLVQMALKDAEGKLEEDIDVKKLRRDQPLMFAVLGDPATSLRLPTITRLAVKKVGERWQWKPEWAPRGARRNERVDWRPARPPRLPRTKDLSERNVRARHARAIETRSYVTLPIEPGKEPGGFIDRKGWLRVLDMSGDALRIGLAEVK